MVFVEGRFQYNNHTAGTTKNMLVWLVPHVSSIIIFHYFISEMQLNSKTKHIADKVSKVRAETIRPTKKAKDQGAKNIAQIIHQSGEGTRFIEEVKHIFYKKYFL